VSAPLQGPGGAGLPDGATGPDGTPATRRSRYTPAETGELRKAAQSFEALFVQMMVQRMRDAQLDEGFFGQGAGSSVYEGMFESYLSDDLAQKSPLGIADMLLQQWGVGPGAGPAGRGRSEALVEARRAAAAVEADRGVRAWQRALASAPAGTQVSKETADESAGSDETTGPADPGR